MQSFNLDAVKSQATAYVEISSRDLRGCRPLLVNKRVHGSASRSNLLALAGIKVYFMCTSSPLEAFQSCQRLSLVALAVRLYEFKGQAVVGLERTIVGEYGAAILTVVGPP